MQKVTIGRLSRASGVHLETIRYYERIGLLQKPMRTAGGHRAYAAQDLERLVFIRSSREMGFGLDAIRDLLKLAEREEGACGAVQALAHKHVAAIDAKMLQLARMKTILTRVLSACSAEPLPSEPCPLLDYLRASKAESRSSCCEAS